MALFVHLTSRADIARVQRSGVHTSSGQGDVRGVFCFPILPSYTVTHQWLNALGPHHEPHGLVAVDVCLPDDEPVTVGHFDDPNARVVTALKAVRLISELEDPSGWEVVVPRPILPDEVRCIREVRRLADRSSLPEPIAHVMTEGPADPFPDSVPTPYPRFPAPSPTRAG